MKGCVRALAAGLGLAAALAVFAAAPAAAYYIKGPAYLAKNTLNGAAVTVSTDNIGGEYFSQLSITNLSFWTLSGVPAGATVTIASGADGGNYHRPNSPRDAVLTLSFSGDFTADWDLSITGATSLFNLSDYSQSFGTIRVQVSGARLRVGSVSGQATEAGGASTFPVRLWTQPSAAVTVSVTSRDTSEGTVGPSSLVFNTSNWNTAQTVTVTGVDDNVDDETVTWQVRLDPSSGDSGYNGLANVDVSVTTTDDDATATATLALNPASITEDGGISTVTARLSRPTTVATTLTVSTAAVSPAVSGDFTQSGTTLAVAAGATTSTGLVTVTAVDNSVGAANKSVTVSATASGGRGVAAPSDVTLTIVEDDFGLDVGAVNGQATEAGGTATFTVALLTQPTAAVTVSVSSRDTGEGTAGPSSLIFNTSNWNTAQTVTVTGVQDTIDDGTVTWQVRLDPSSGDTNYNGLANMDVDVTTEDDDSPPGVTLSLNPSSIAESGAGNVATVSARLSHPSGAATTVTVTAVSGVFTAGSGAAGTIVIPAEQTTAASDTALVTAVDNDTDAPDRTATVTATIANARATADSETMSVTGASLTVRDDDAAPGVALALDPASIAEPSGVSTVSATLSHPSSEPSTVTVTAVPGAYTVGTDATITIAAGSTTAASDTVLITVVNDDLHHGNAGRSATVTAALTNGQGAGSVTGAALTITDDETLPTVALVLDPASISEEGGLSTVTATLSSKSSEAATVTVAAVAGTGAVAADFDLSTATTLTIAAGATTSAGVVTVTANGNAVASGSKSVTVSGTSSGGNSVANPPAATLTITDDDTPQTALVLSSNSISENGGVATVTATLDRQSTAAVTVTVAAAAGANTAAGDFTLSTAATLTFAANATVSTGLVTVAAVNDTTDAPDKSVTVSGMSSDSLGLTNDPPDVTLAITDDDAGPGVTLALNPSSIAEPNGVSTVSATLSHPSSEPSTVTVTAVSGAYTAGTDATIVIAAGATTAASDTALIVVVDDDLHHGSAGRSATVTGALTNGQGAGAVTGASLTITDDETLPVASLVFSPGSISENGGVATITAALSGLSGKSSEATTVTVAVAAVASSGAVSGDFTLSTATTLTVVAGATTSTGLVTVTAVDNNLDIGTAQKQLRVSGTTTGGNGIQNPALGLLLIDDDDDATASLVLDPSTILENGGVSTVTARLSHPTNEAATLTVAAAAGAGAVAADFSLSGTTTLTIAANATTSAGLVTITAVDNNVATGNKRVTVSATASGGRGVSAPSDATLILRDDEFGLSESAVSGQATEGGGTATFTVRLNTEPSAAVTVSVTSRDASEGTVSPSSLVFTTGSWNTAQTVTARGVDDSIDDGDVVWQVRLDPSSGDSDYNAVTAVDVDVTTTDDDGTPTASLVLLPSSIGENGGISTVEARLSHGSGAAVTVTVSFAAVSPAVAGDFTESAALTLTIAAEETSSTGLVTVTANDNTVVSPDKSVTVSTSSVTGGFATPSAPEAVTLTIENDDEGMIDLSPESVTVTAGGAGTEYTVALTRVPAGAVTVTVTVENNDDVRVDPGSLTFTMGNWNIAQTVTVRASTDGDDYADAAKIAHEASGSGYGGEARKTLDVAVAEDTVIVTRGAEGETTYTVNGRSVVVTEKSGVPAGVEVDLDGVGAGPSLGLTYSTVAAATVAAAEGDGFGGLDPATVVDISVTGTVPSSGLLVCLDVSPDLLRAARRSAGRDPVLLRHDGSVWAEAGPDGSSPNAAGTQVCARGVVEFSPFAVGYEDTSPVFPEFTMTSMVFTVNQAVETDPLPLAVGGDGTEHRLSPARLVERLEAVGVEFDRARRVFSGTPTKAFAEEEFTWTATDVDGDEDDLTFTIAVKAALEDARARLTAINESVLPELSRAMWGSALDAVTGRLGGGGVPGAGGSAGLAGGLAAVDALLRANADKLEDGRASLRELVDGRRVALRLGASGSGGSGAGSQGAVVWMSGDWRKLSRKQAGLDWSGDLFAAHVGADAALGPRLRGGIAASRYASAVTYTDGSALARATAGAAVVGVHRTRMTTATPYIGVTGDRARAWAALGLGGGRVEIDDAEVVNQRLGEQSSGARFTAAALGGSARLSSGGSVEVRVKASGETSRFTVRGNGEEGAIAPLAATAQRLRLSAEGSRTWALASGAELTPALEVGGRWDGGGGVTGAGLEIGGGVVWSDPGAGLTMEARARALVAHRGGAREHGVSAAVRLEPGARGRGLSLSLSPSWGKAESGMERLWRTGAVAAEAKPRSAPRLEAELGYGVAALGGSATLTPYGGFGLGEDGERRWRLGGRLELGQTFGLRLEAGHRDSPTTRPDNGIALHLDARW